MQTIKKKYRTFKLDKESFASTHLPIYIIIINTSQVFCSNAVEMLIPLIPNQLLSISHLFPIIGGKRM